VSTLSAGGAQRKTPLQLTGGRGRTRPRSIGALLEIVGLCVSNKRRALERSDTRKGDVLQVTPR
jgi:hypothetical protein